MLLLEFFFVFAILIGVGYSLRVDAHDLSQDGNMEPEETNSSIHTEPPVEGWEHQPTYKTFDTIMVHPKTNVQTYGTETDGMDKWQCISHPHPHPTYM